MKGTPHNSIVDFLCDEKFRDWVMNPTPELDSYWEQWLVWYPSKRGLIVEAQQVLLNVQYKGHSSPRGMKDKLFAQIVNQSASKQPSKSFKIWSIRPMLAYAAVLLLLILSGVVATVFMWSGSEPMETQVAEMMMRQTRLGETMSLRLSDGTRVKLNAGSTIEFPEHFGTLREVRLEGEAFFDVARDASRPFIIHSDLANVEVLGTSFNVNTEAAGGEAMEVAVASGKVSVSSPYHGEGVLLEKHDQVRLTTDQFTLGRVDASKTFGWKDGLLVFRGCSAEAVALKLTNWYGVDVRLDPSLPKKISFNGSFKNEPLERVLQGLQYTSGINYSLENNLVTLKR